MNPSVAVLGLGAMGSRMAARLLERGYEVHVYNRNPARARSLAERGARLADTPKDAASACEFVIGMLRDDEAAQAVWFDQQRGAALGLGRDATAIESSTLTPAFAAHWHRELRERGVASLDAPVSGSRPQAEAGKLIYLVGGEAEPLERARPVLSILGNTIHHIGPASSGMVMKLAINALFAVQAAAFAEVLGLTRHAELNQAVVADVLGSLPITSPALGAMLGLMTSRRFDPMFPIELVEKDLAYVEATALALGAEVPSSSAAHASFARALARDLGAENIAAICKVFEA